MTTAMSSTTSTPSTTTTTTTTTPPSCSHPDTVIFGSLAFTIADDLSQTIDSSLLQNVASLPGDDDNLKLLQQKLRRVYFRNVDVLESYMIRNIFTLDNVPRKKQVLQALLLEKNTNAILNTAKENTANDAQSSVKVQQYEYPTNIPSQQELQELQMDVLEKRKELRAARQCRNERFAKLDALTSAHGAIQGVTSSLSNTESPNHKEITKMISSKDDLEQLQVNATELKKRLQETASQRPTNDEELEEFATKKQKLSLEQLYQQQRQATQTTQSALSNVTKLLQK